MISFVLLGAVSYAAMLPNHSLEATWDAPRFAHDGPDLLSLRTGVGESPGASARGR
jgi:hypothetical protein